MTWAAPAEVERFDDAVDWFMARTVMTKDQAATLTQGARKDAFWVGAGLQADQVQRVMDEITDALETGEAFEEWRERVRNDLFSDAHAETVFRNAVQRSYNAGRWEQMHDPDVLALRPYGIVDAILDEATTDYCESVNETVLPLDHEWWLTHWFPAHHRCRTTVRNVRKSEAERRGISVPPDVEPAEGFGEIPTPLNGWKPDRDRYEARIREELERKEKLRNAPPPETPHEPATWAKKYEKRYGKDASKSLGWGRASVETGMDLPIEEVRDQIKRLPSTKSRADMLESLKGATGTLRRSGGELDPIRKAAAGVAGHLKAIPDRAAIVAAGLPQRGAGKRAQDFFTEMTGPEMVHPEDFTFERRSTRAGAAPWDKYIRYRAATGILEHEWAHALDYLNPELAVRARSFREVRTKGDKLTIITPGEWGKRDEFLDHYIGKFYNDAESKDFTEITSMGVELLVAGKTEWGTLQQLLRRDPEYFFFILGQLAGR